MNHASRRFVSVCFAVVILAGSLWLGNTTVAQARQSGASPPPGTFSPDQLVGNLGQQLVEGLQATPGCLGAEAAAFSSGKLVIFGWFQDKAAAMAWHESDVHVQVSQRFSGGRKMDAIPMAHIPDGVPLMVVASVKMEPPTSNGPPKMKFGIEVYQPLPGGFSFEGGAFSPEAFQTEMASLRKEATEKP